MAEVNYSFTTLRRITLLEKRVESVHVSLYFTIMATFVVLLFTMYDLRRQLKGS